MICSKYRSVFWVGIFLSVCGCQTTNVAPFSKEGAENLAADEERIWARSTEEQEMLRKSGLLVNTPEVEAYLLSIVQRLNPVALPRGNKFSINVVLDPSLNAMAFPNGQIYVHTGLLVRLENEAQIALILAHEVTHATHRHALRSKRQIENALVFNAITLGTGSLFALGSVSGYSQHQEREADDVGFQLFIAAGYDPREASKVFRLLQAEAKRSKIKEPYFFGSHPRLAERIASFERLFAALPAANRSGEKNTETYQSFRSLMLEKNARAALSAGDPDFALENTETYLRRDPKSRDVRFLQAEILRRRASGTDADKALEILRGIVTDYPDFSDPQRSLGLIHFKQKKFPEAAQAFELYLKLSPEASDRSHIESLQKQCAQN